MATYFYQCPRCRTRFELRARATVRRRRCPECGLPITIREIDRQREAAARRSEAAYAEYLDELAHRRRQRALRSCVGGLLSLALIGLCCGVPIYWVATLPGKAPKTEPRQAADDRKAAPAPRPDRGGAPAIAPGDPPAAADVGPMPHVVDVRFGMALQDRQEVYAAWHKAPADAERRTIEEMGHRPRGTDTVAYGAKFVRAVEARTKEAREALLKAWKLNQVTMDNILREGKAAGWPVPPAPPVKEKD